MDKPRVVPESIHELPETVETFRRKLSGGNLPGDTYAFWMSVRDLVETGYPYDSLRLLSKPQLRRLMVCTRQLGNELFCLKDADPRVRELLRFYANAMFEFFDDQQDRKKSGKISAHRRGLRVIRPPRGKN